MTQTKLHSAAKEVRLAANSLQVKKHPLAARVLRLAQWMEKDGLRDTSGLTTAAPYDLRVLETKKKSKDFDPSQEETPEMQEEAPEPEMSEDTQEMPEDESDMQGEDVEMPIKAAPKGPVSKSPGLASPAPESPASDVPDPGEVAPSNVGQASPGGMVQPGLITHTCSVSFDTAPDIDEEILMRYILDIDKTVPAKVHSFQWKGKDTSQGAATTASVVYLREAATNVRTAARRLAVHNHRLVPELMRLAQMIQPGVNEMSGAGGMGGPTAMPFAGHSIGSGFDGFDPSQEPMADQSSGQDPMADQSSGKHLHPGIESFVKEPEAGVLPEVKTHTCSVSFDAAPDVNEEDMMKFILSISDNLAVKVHGFQWRAKENKNRSSGSN